MAEYHFAGPADASLVPSKEGYHAIKLEGCEFLLATTSDGRLDLSDVYVQVRNMHAAEHKHLHLLPAKHKQTFHISISEHSYDASLCL